MYKIKTKLVVYCLAYFLPVKMRETGVRTTLLKKKYEYGHSTGYEAYVWSYTLCRPQTEEDEGKG